jgi:hypothetical protein
LLGGIIRVFEDRKLHQDPCKDPEIHIDGIEVDLPTFKAVQSYRHQKSEEPGRAGAEGRTLQLLM